MDLPQNLKGTGKRHFVPESLRGRESDDISRNLLYFAFTRSTSQSSGEFLGRFPTALSQLCRRYEGQQSDQRYVF